MITPALFPYSAAQRFAALAAILLLAAVCWTTVVLWDVSRRSDAVDATLLADTHQRQELATTVERLFRFGEIILHAPEKQVRKEALDGARGLASAFTGPGGDSESGKRAREVLNAVFAQLTELATNRSEQDRFDGLIAKRLQAFDALVNSVVKKIPAGSDTWNIALILAQLRLELEHTDATAKTRWALLVDELTTQAKVLRLEGANSIALLLDRVPGQVEDLAQLRQRVRDYHNSSHEQWEAAAELLEKLAGDLAVHDTPAELHLEALHAEANMAMAILLSAVALSLGLGYAAYRKRDIGMRPRVYDASFPASPKVPPPSQTGADATPEAQSVLPEAPRLSAYDADDTAEPPEMLLPELRNRFAQADPSSLAPADSLRKVLADGPYKTLADEIYVRAAFGEYGKALESLEKLSGKMREDGEAPY